MSVLMGMILENIREKIKTASITQLLLVIVVVWLVGGYVFNPATWTLDKVNDKTPVGDVTSEVNDQLNNIGVFAGVVHDQCPSGWKDNNAHTLDTAVRACFKKIGVAPDGSDVGWQVVLNSDGTFNVMIPIGQVGKGFVTTEEEAAVVAGW